jgi:hypothetical protein
MKRIHYYLLLLVTLGQFTCLKAQVTAYTMTPSITSFVPVSGGTRLTALEDNIAIATIPIGFSFNLEGTTYTQLKATSDGYATFNSTTPFTTPHNNLAFVAPNQLPLIAALWDDNDGRAAGLAMSKFEYLTSGVAPNRILTLEWLNWEWASGANADVISFQLKLYETTNEIEFIYRQDGAPPSKASASIGLASNNGFLSLQNTSTLPTISTSISANNLSTKPATGQSYLFTPPSCPSPSNLRQTSATVNSIELEWVPGGASFFQVEYGAPGHGVGTGTIMSTSSNSYTISGLTNGSCLEVYVRDSCGPADSSTWTGPILMCTAVNAPMLETFDANPPSRLIAPTQHVYSYANGWLAVSNSKLSIWNWLPSDQASGPAIDHTSGSGIFMYAENGSGSSGDSTWLYSPFIDLSGVTTPTLRLWYHKQRFAASLADMLIEADTNGSGNWIVVDDTSMLGATHSGPATSDPWTSLTLPLTGFENIVQFRITQVKRNCCDQAAIDDFEIFDAAPNDLKMVELLSPKKGSCEGNSTQVTVKIQNEGTNTITAFDLSYQISGQAAVTEHVTATILPFNTYVYTFKKNETPVSGLLEIVAWTHLSGDANLANDTLTDTAKIDIAPTIDAYLYSFGFEEPNQGWSTGGASNSWEIGIPTASYISSPANGNQAAVTELNGNHNRNEDSYLLSPCFDFSRFTSEPTLGFQHSYNLDMFDYHWLEVSRNGGFSWDTLGKKGLGSNWYNSVDYWGGNHTAGAGAWQPAQLTTERLAGKSAVRFRFRLKSDLFGELEGAGIDDFFVVVPPNDLFPDTLSTCNASSFTLDAGGIYPDTLVSYLWSNGSTTKSIVVTQPGTYSVTITDKLAGISTLEQVEVIAQDAPLVQFKNKVDTIDFFGFPIAIKPSPALPENYNYTWTWQGTSTHLPYFLADPEVMGTGKHTIEVEVIDPYGCRTITQHELFISDFVGITENTTVDLSVFPNPASNTITLLNNGVNNKTGQYQVSLTNAHGTIVMNQSVTMQAGKPIVLTVDHLPRGMYLLQLQNGNTTVNKKMILN